MVNNKNEIDVKVSVEDGYVNVLVLEIDGVTFLGPCFSLKTKDAYRARAELIEKLSSGKIVVDKDFNG